jgi:hypothetical protein
VGVDHVLRFYDVLGEAGTVGVVEINFAGTQGLGHARTAVEIYVSVGTRLERDVKHIADHGQNGAGNRLQFFHDEPSDGLFARRLGSGALVLVIPELFRIGHCLLVIEEEVHHIDVLNDRVGDFVVDWVGEVEDVETVENWFYGSRSSLVKER